MIGPYTSACAKVTIPLTARSSQPLPLISPSNTLPGLTHRTAASAYGEPERYYPTGVRNDFRVVASDDLQGAGQAVLAHDLGLRRVYLLSTTTPYGVPIAEAFRRAAVREKVEVAGSGSWGPGARRAIVRSRPDGVVLAGFDPTGGAVIRALRGRLGSRVPLIADDGFLPVPTIVKEAGKAATGMDVTFPGVVDAGGTYVPEAAAAAQVLLRRDRSLGRDAGLRARRVAPASYHHRSRPGPVRPERRHDAGARRRRPHRSGCGSALTGQFRESTLVDLVNVPTALVG